MHRSLSITLLIGLAAITPRAGAQVIRGDVTDAVTHAPLPGAIIIVLDSAGGRVSGALADDSGNFAVRLRSPGLYRLTSERVGYASPPPDSVVLGVGESAVMHLRVPSIAVVLPQITVRSDSRCVVGPAEGEATAALWIEARKALYATELGERGRIRAVRRWFWRLYDGFSLALRHDSTRVDTVLLARPWETTVTPERLARDGYALNKEGDSLAAPDAIVLLSDAFARTHCFHMHRDPEKEPGLLGIAFVPSIKRHAPDVMGVIWVDSATAKLRFVEFRHTELFPEVSPSKYGGRMDFEQLPSGAWIVRRWKIRLPVLASTAVGPDGTADPRMMNGSPHVAYYHENGGELLSAEVVSVAPPP